ncbi:MAG: YARHG domain-containing protein [Pseudobutyrivibrio sp.]|nr:YARHG domain-containing protein [Pseudobutyrivibrio sp.]
MTERERELREERRRRRIRQRICELMIAVAVGIFAGCIAFGLLFAEKKHKDGLKISNETEVVAEETTEEPAEEVTEEPVEEEETEEEETTEFDTSAFAAPVQDWSQEEIEAAISERSGYVEKSKYWPAVSAYWEGDRSVTDTACYAMYLFDTDTKVYTAEDFEGVPKQVLYVAKNEIYARHGYSFKNQDLYNYFMGQIWYNPSIMPADFTEDMFSETEVKNLDLLNTLDK